LNKATILQIKNLRMEHSGRGIKILHLSDISLKIEEHTFTAILGPQNSNKSLLCEIIAGLVEPTLGKIERSGIIAYIPSKPSSFPWLNVRENIELGINHNKTGKKITLADLVELTGIAGYEDHFPKNKSLGFRFRVTLARALASGAELIVLDEPFKDMDQLTKFEIYSLIRNVYKFTGISFIIATSNITEAVFFGEKIFIISSASSGIIHETSNHISDQKIEFIFQETVFKEKVKEVEDLVKTGESLIFNSYLI